MNTKKPNLRKPSSLEILLTADDIKQAIRLCAKRLNREYHSKRPVLLMLLKGSICFVSDLMRELTFPFSLETISCSRYGQRGISGGDLKIIGLETLDLENQDVIVLDDIFDEGITLFEVMYHLKNKHPRSLKSIALLSKDHSQIKGFQPDEVLFHIPDVFVVGYGLDYKENYRGLKDLCVLSGEDNGA